MPTTRSGLCEAFAISVIESDEVLVANMNERGVIDSRLPGAGQQPPYSRFGDSIFFGLMALCAATKVWLSRKVLAKSKS